MLALQVKKKFAPCWIAALLAYVVAQVCFSIFFTLPGFLLGNFGEPE